MGTRREARLTSGRGRRGTDFGTWSAESRSRRIPERCGDSSLSGRRLSCRTIHHPPSPEKARHERPREASGRSARRSPRQEVQGLRAPTPWQSDGRGRDAGGRHLGVARLVAAGAGRGELVEEPTMAKRCALYARVSTTEQTAENQLLALRAFTGARGWEPAEFIDQGQSGAKERRPALDAMMAAVRTRKVDVVVATKLDRLARSVHHLVAMGQELHALGV